MSDPPKLPTQPQKYPPGHNQKYWKNHPEQLAAELAKQAQVAANNMEGLVKEEGKKKRISTPDFLAIASLMAGLIIPLLQANGVEVRWLTSGILDAILIAIFLRAFGRWEVAWHWSGRVRKVMMAICAFALISLCTCAVIKEYSREQVPPSVVAVTAKSKTLGHGNGEKVGTIDWKDGYAEVRLEIENSEEATIQNLDLNVSLAGETVILDMGPFNDSQGCEFHHPTLKLPNDRIKTAAEGSVSLAELFERAFDVRKLIVPSNQWRLFCSRLVGKSEVELVVATPSKDNVTIATKIRVFGSYELMPGEGSRKVKVDTIAKIIQ